MDLDTEQESLINNLDPRNYEKGSLEEDACRCLYETIHSFHELAGIRAWMEWASLSIRRLLIKLKYADELADILESMLKAPGPGNISINQTKESLQNYRDASDFSWGGEVDGYIDRTDHSDSNV